MSRVAPSRRPLRAMAPPTSAQAPNRAGVFEDLDFASSVLILRLQIEDINQLLGARNNALSGWDQTLLAQKEELQRALSTLTDRRIGLGMSHALAQDIKAVNALVDEERQAENDRAMACELAGLPAPPRSAVQPLATLSVLPAQQTRRMAASANGLGSQNTKNRHHRVESTRDCVNEESENMDLDEPRRKRDKVGSQVIDLTLPEKPATLPCVSCGDDYDPTLLAHMACEHDYCQDCVQRVVVNALNDEACYPPRCCRQPFHIDAMRHFLTPEIISGFHEKQIEFGTTNRIYCSNPTCSTFLYPANITRDRGDCPICLVATCTICKGASHSGDCPQDTGVQQVLALANGEGWRRCSKCKAVVELGHGCNHITCRCKAEWCYVCCAAWKTCPCPTWHEDRLLARAEHIVDQQPAAAPQPPQLQRPQQVAAARQYALEHHNCDHQAWSKVGGFANCDECGRDCNKYRFQCVGCRMDACYACRMYRL